MIVFSAPEGSTADMNWRISQTDSDGVKTYPDLTGKTVTLVLNGADGTAIDTTGNFSVIDPANARVRFTPDAADLVVAKSPLRGRVKVSAGLQDVYYPGDFDPFLIRVAPVA